MTINNNNIFGAFTLGEVRSGQLTGEWLNKETVANYGWFGGGNPSPIIVSRVDFSNDSVTASPRGSLSRHRSRLAATGNSNYGWFGGGFDSIDASVFSRIDRIDFSNDSPTTSVRGPLSLPFYGRAATGNSNYGWFGGGYAPTSFRTTVDRIDFSNDANITSIRGPLSLARGYSAATGNSNYGWFGGGLLIGPPRLSTVDRIDFSNDSATASTRGSLSLARESLAATGNSNYGWFGGGRGDSLAVHTTIQRIDFSNDSSTASVRGPLSTFSRTGASATGNSNYGWFGGGYNFPSHYSLVDRIDFSNDLATASPRGPLSAARSYLAATSGVLNIRRQKAGNYGWFGGGFTTIQVATVDRIDFSNDSSAVSVRGPLSLARYGFAATGNTNYGWFGGGTPGPLGGPATARVDRIDFSNDSATASVRGSLSLGRFYLAATGNSSYGWFGGGATPTQVSTVDRIDFSNDSATASPRGPLNAPAGKSSMAATGNSSYGWFGGGTTPTAILSTVDRIDFSNDSATASVRGPLSLARYDLAATGNSNYGWFGGGNPGPLATVDRIDFSNDSLTALVRGTLSSPRSQLSATGNSNYGWFGGGYNPSLPVRKSTVDRINFSNDSVSASPRGSISASPGILYPTATSNTNK